MVVLINGLIKSWWHGCLFWIRFWTSKKEWKIWFFGKEHFKGFPICSTPVPSGIVSQVKKAAAKTTTNRDVEKDIEQYVQAMSARQQFIGATLNMSWRLALTVLIPLVGGIKLDQHFGTSPSWTFTGLIIAIFFGCLTVLDTVKEVNRLQAEESKEKKK
jgi:predicted F0F1-ATPase subunit